MLALARVGDRAGHVEDDGQTRGGRRGDEQPPPDPGAEARARRRERLEGMPVEDDEPAAQAVPRGDGGQQPQPAEAAQQPETGHAPGAGAGGIETGVEETDGPRVRARQRRRERRLAGAVGAEQRERAAAPAQRDEHLRQPARERVQREHRDGRRLRQQPPSPQRPRQRQQPRERALPRGREQRLRRPPVREAPLEQRRRRRGRRRDLRERAQLPGVAPGRAVVEQAVQEQEPEGVVRRRQGEAAAPPAPLQHALREPARAQLVPRAERERRDDVKLRPAVGRGVVREQRPVRAGPPRRQRHEAERRERPLGPRAVGRRDEQVDVPLERRQLRRAAQQAPGDIGRVEPPERRGEQRVRRERRGHYAPERRTTAPTVCDRIQRSSRSDIRRM